MEECLALGTIRDVARSSHLMFERILPLREPHPLARRQHVPDSSNHIRAAVDDQAMRLARSAVRG